MSSDETPKKRNPVIYVWLAVSTVLSLSGMAGIVESIVTWVGFSVISSLCTTP